MTTMPISPIVLQRRHAEQGRIRLGEKKTTSGGKTYPSKLSTFRFTSANRSLIDAVAELYGGQARPWDNGGKSEFEVLTDATSVPVIVVRGGFSQWMEAWSGGGCVHRCDGVTNVLTGEPCDPDDRAHIEAKPTTRLSVMLRDVETLGVWRLESHGWNAAAELPMLAELAQHVGDLVPATLHLVERKAIKNGQTSRFVVPVLDLAVSKQRLVEIAGGLASGAPAELAGAPSAPAAIEAPRPDYTGMLAGAGSVEECQEIWRAAGQAGHLDDALKAAITERARSLKPVEGVVEEPAAQQAPVAAPAGDVDAAWSALVAEAGRAGMTDGQLRAALEAEFAQPVADLSAEQLTGFLAQVRADEAGAA